ncbi:hypothetical protein KC19_3G065500 [Ceratodon purpureus]|uniref:Zinc finger protein n=1 Tax=Ceratodon purpureus TaxID=3225 RepID=A0A8T0II03_CERPU|nr:hypothetical protein KC19_3G065500 [Ceratodon purpureus]
MPKRKTGARKKAEGMRIRQKEISNKKYVVDLGKHPCNQNMTCDYCHKTQKNRAFCYFCASFPKTPACAQCGKIKCMASSSDCVVRHPGRNVSGLGMVGAVCDFCEAFICHSRKCLTTHACSCPLVDATCIECERVVWDHGGRLFRCFSCDMWLCEDDQFEHQASCQQLDTETFHCLSCNRTGLYTCLRCKICFCDEHVKGVTNVAKRGEALMCKKCAYPLKETKDISVSVRIHKFGRQAAGGGDGGYDDYQEGTSGGDGGYGGYGGFSGYGGSYGGHTHDDDDEDDDDDDDDEEGSDDEEDDDEDDEEEDEYGGGQSVGMAALNIKEFKIEGGGSSNTKGKSSK